MHGIEKLYIFLFSAPQVSAWGPCFRSVDCFLLVGMVASPCGGFRGGGGSRSTASTGGFSPLQGPWCRFTWSPGLFLWSYCLRHVQVVAATAAPPVLHTLRQPGFPRKLRLRGCRRWLRLQILSGRSPLGRSLCSVSSSASSPSTLVASWYGG